MACKPEQIGTKEHDGRVPAKEAKHWKIHGQKRRIARKVYRQKDCGI